jgi:ATP-dependent Lon protease
MAPTIKSKINNRRQKKQQDSSSSSSSSSSQSDSSDTDTDETGEMDKERERCDSPRKKPNAKYTNFLSKMFPSKYMDKKNAIVQKGQTQGQQTQGQQTQGQTQGDNRIKDREKEKDRKEDRIKDREKEKEKEKEKDDKDKSSRNVNIFFTVDEVGDDDDEWEDEEDDSDYASDEEESDEEDEDVSVSSDEDTGSSSDGEEDDTTAGSSNQDDVSIDQNSELLTKLIELQQQQLSSKSGKPDKMVEECIIACKEKIRQINKKQNKKSVKQKEKNRRIFKKMLSVKKLTHELVFFKKMPIENQKRLIKELREINKIICIEKPYRLSLLESPIPILHKSIAMKKINLLKSMDENCSEYYKIKHWVDTFMRIPFGKYNSLPITMQDGIESSNQFMESAKQMLDTAVYGLNDAKMQIMQLLGQLITNPDAIGCAVAIKGPPGTGKTSLVKEGISKILNRPFAFIALGGATDSSFLEGHSYTYEGSTWGKIVQILIDSKSMNPVIYFDELDKISGTPKGDEIVGILTHLTDSSQNSQFHDKYFSEIDFDLSKCLFIFSYNDESKISPILRDRMYRIQTKGYDKKQKTIIATQYLLPKIQEQVRFNQGDILISDDVLHYIVENYCEKEDGVRNQKRCLEIIYTKLNLYRLMRPGSSLFEADMTMPVSFPFQVTKQIVDKLIKISKDENFSKSMYI